MNDIRNFVDKIDKASKLIDSYIKSSANNIDSELSNAIEILNKNKCKFQDVKLLYNKVVDFYEKLEFSEIYLPDSFHSPGDKPGVRIGREGFYYVCPSTHPNVYDGTGDCIIIDYDGKISLGVLDIYNRDNKSRYSIHRDYKDIADIKQFVQSIPDDYFLNTRHYEVSEFINAFTQIPTVIDSFYKWIDETDFTHMWNWSDVKKRNEALK